MIKYNLQNITATAAYLPNVTSGDQWVSYINHGDFNGDGRTDFVRAGWTFRSADSITLNEPLKFFIFGQAADGSFSDITESIAPNNTINGAGQIGVEDFNKDGIDDIVLLGFTDFPCLAVNGFIFLSQKNTSYHAILTKPTRAHGIAIGDWNGDGYPDILASGYNPVDELLIFKPPQSFNALVGPSNNIGGSGSAIGDINNDGKQDLVIVDAYLGESQTANDILVYLQTADGKVPDKWTYSLPAQLGSQSHEIRAELLDLNSDGWRDLIVYEQLYQGLNGATQFKTLISIWQNDKTGKFIQKTNDWLPNQFQDSNPDYSWQWLDLDGNDTLDLAMGSRQWGDRNQNNTIYLNDGSGKLHLVMHNEFVDLGNKVASEIQKQKGLYVNSKSVGDFVAYLDENKNVDFFWSGNVFGATTDKKANYDISAQVNTNINFNSDLTEGFIISGTDKPDRLFSWAGNDTFDGNQGNDIIDGGKAIDIAHYHGKVSEYKITLGENVVDITDFLISRDGSDTLINIERLKFSDTNIALDINDNAGEAYRIYEAAFNRKPDAGGLGYWISQLDKGATLKSVAEGFLGSGEFKALYGSSPTNAVFVDNLYKNILDRAGEKGGVDYWNGVLNNGVSRADVLVSFSESAENKAGVIGSIQNGIEYKEWLG